MVKAAVGLTQGGQSRMSLVDRQVILEFPARAEYVVLGRLALTGLLRDQGYSEEWLTDLRLALTEACTNSIRHAYNDGQGTVQISYELRDDRVLLCIYDHGDGFKEQEAEVVGEAPDVSLLPTEGGMGMALIRAVVDEFRLEQPEDGGTCLWLMKRRDA